MKPQYNSLDISRGLAILAVVFIHSSSLFLAVNCNKGVYFLHQLCYFCVPLFISVSGFLHAVSSENNKAVPSFSLLSYIQRRFMRLIVPYLAFSILYVCIRILLEHLPVSTNLFPHRFGNFNTVISAILLAKGNPAGQLYFLPLLFFITMLFKILEVALEKYPILLILLCVAISIASYALWGDIYRSLNPLKGVGFYAAGYFMFSRRSIKPYLLETIAAGTCILFIAGTLAPQLPSIQFVCQSCGAAFVFCLSLLLSKSLERNHFKTALTNLGRASFAIYLLHEPYIVTVSYLVTTKILHFPPFVALAVTAIFGIGIPIVMNKFILTKSTFLMKWFFGETARQKLARENENSY
jgi:peptidoglycan/LPS O-acetylase OafA/YrhL